MGQSLQVLQVFKVFRFFRVFGFFRVFRIRPGDWFCPPVSGTKCWGFCPTFNSSTLLINKFFNSFQQFILSKKERTKFNTFFKGRMNE
jgi:hypothetical protein